MKRIILALLILCASIFVGVELVRDPGYVLIAIGNWTLETSIWIAILGMLIIFLLLYELIALATYLKSIPNRLQTLRAQKDFAKLIERTTYWNMLTEYRNQTNPAILRKFFKALPKYLQREPEFICEYCNNLTKAGAPTRAEKILRRSLAKNPNSALLMLAMRRLSKHSQLWGKAKTYLEKSIALDPTPEALQELADLFDKIGESPKACATYQKALTLALTSKVNSELHK